MSASISCASVAAAAVATADRPTASARAPAAAPRVLSAAAARARGTAALKAAAARTPSTRAASSFRVAAAVQAEVDTLPAGYNRYETMLVLRPNITDEERDRELAKFEVFLKNQEAVEINAMVRGRQRMAYPMQGHWEGIYVLYTYASKGSTAPEVQVMLSKPDIESEGYLLRHMTFRC